MNRTIQIIRGWLIFFMISLFIIGLTAMPLETELLLLLRWLEPGNILEPWIRTVYLAIKDMNQQYPFLAYGYDWLAFAHFLLAILFIGPYRDPVKNKWVIEFGMIACVLVIPFALIAGHFRGIPMGWRLIDCAFGIAGVFPLGFCLYKIGMLENKSTQQVPVYI